MRHEAILHHHEDVLHPIITVDVCLDPLSKSVAGSTPSRVSGVLIGTFNIGPTTYQHEVIIVTDVISLYKVSLAMHDKSIP